MRNGVMLPGISMRGAIGQTLLPVSGSFTLAIFCHNGPFFNHLHSVQVFTYFGCLALCSKAVSATNASTSFAGGIRSEESAGLRPPRLELKAAAPSNRKLEASGVAAAPSQLEAAPSQLEAAPSELEAAGETAAPEELGGDDVGGGPRCCPGRRLKIHNVRST